MPALLLLLSCKKDEAAAPPKPAYIVSYLDPGTVCEDRNYVHFTVSGREYTFEEGITGRYRRGLNNCTGHSFNVSTFFDSLRYQVPGGQEVASIYFLVDKSFITPANYRIGDFCGNITGMQFEFLPVDSVTYWRAFLKKKSDNDYFRITRIEGDRVCGEFSAGTTEPSIDVIRGDFSVLLR